MKQKIFALLLLFTPLMVQARTITGTVTDQTGETIISASVIVKGTTIGTVTDFDGNYSLDVPADAKTLVFSYIGLVTQEVAITQDVINVVLKEDNEVLEEVVVTGYGTTKKRDLVTSVASVSGDQLKDIPVTTAAEALQGKLAGVSVVTTEGSPDADVKIRVRGGTSLTQSSDPLYIVDGFPVSSINDIAPGDIASMDVLKDAAATAIYGAQGANGVIIITTKDVSADDADKMQFHVDYTGYMGWRTLAKKYDMMSTDEFVLMQWEAAKTLKGTTESDLNSNFYSYFDPQYAAQQTVESRMSVPNIISYWSDDAEKTTDWQEKTFGENGLNSNHTVSLSGGNKMATFNLTYNRVDDEGIMYGSDYERNNLNFKSKFKPFKGFTMAFNARYSKTYVLGSGANTIDDSGSKSESRVRNAIAYSPVELLKQSSSADPDYEYFGSLYDPITTVDHNYRTKNDQKYVLSGYLQYKFLKDFTLKADLGYENRDKAEDRFYGPTTYYSGPNGTAKTLAGDAFMGNTISTDYKISRLRETFTFNYAHKWNNAHNFSVLLGQELNVYKGETRTTYAYGFDKTFTGPQVFQHLGQSVDSRVKNYVDPTDNMLSFFTRINYDYKGRYYATVTFRADGSSRFSKENQWGYFPSVALAWRIIDEQWMAPAQDVMSNFKLRVSYGTVGNNNVDLGYLYSEYLPSATTYTDFFTNMLKDGGEKVIAANPNLKWETTITRDLGLDFGFFNERLSGTFDVYCNSTKDLILLYKLNTGGYNYQYRNIGSTQNIGVELSMTGVILDHKSKDLNYGLSVNVNISHNQNKVTNLGGMDEYFAATGCFSANYDNADYEFKLTPGSAIGDIYGYRTDGWYSASDFDIYDASKDQWLKLNPKTGKYETLSTKLGVARPGMTKLESEERKKLGNTQPVINGGFGLNFHIGGQKWGNVDLSAQFTYSYGNDVLNLTSLDYSTIFEKTMYRNCSNSVAYGQRYSLFEKNGNYIPASANATVWTGADAAKIAGYNLASQVSVVSGADYAALASRLGESNASAATANPVSEKIALTDKFVEDASFLRMSALTIGYSLPTNVLEKAHISQLRFFFTASNLFCATNYSGNDPEVDTRSKNNPLTPGVDWSAFPKSRAFNFGINLSFE